VEPREAGSGTGGRESPNLTTPAGVEQNHWHKTMENSMFPVCSAPAGAVFFFTAASAGSASRFAGLHRRLFLSHASGVETLAKNPIVSQPATQLKCRVCGTLYVSYCKRQAISHVFFIFFEFFRVPTPPREILFNHNQSHPCFSGPKKNLGAID